MDTDGVSEEVVANSEEQLPATENAEFVEKDTNKAASTNNLPIANIEDDKVFYEYKRLLPRFIRRNMPVSFHIAF